MGLHLLQNLRKWCAAETIQPKALCMRILELPGLPLGRDFEQSRSQAQKLLLVDNYTINAAAAGSLANFAATDEAIFEGVNVSVCEPGADRIRNGERSLNQGFCAAGADGFARCCAAKGSIQGIENNRLTRACFAGQHR